MPTVGPVKRRFKSPYWDVPPTGYEHLSATEYKAMQAAGQVPQSVVNPSSQHLQGTKYARPNATDPMEAVRAAAAVINATLMSARSAGGNYKSSSSAAGGAPPAVTRQARRLYVGNIPFGCTDDELKEFFRLNMDTCRFVKEPGNPILACQINLDKNFAFLEFRTVLETTAAMALDGIHCRGQPLKIRRPHDYQPIPGSEPPPPPVVAALSGALPIDPIMSIAPIQKEVLCLMNLFEPEELRDDNEYLEILEDITTECQKYGVVRSIEVPRPLGEGDMAVPGLGKAFVEFASANDAQRAQQNLGGRRFGNRIAVTSFFDLDRYKNKDF